MSKEISPELKKRNADLAVIVSSSLFVLAIYFLIQNSFTEIVTNTDLPVLWRTLFAAAFQFGVAGLGITLVSLYRKDPFTNHGLRAKGSFLSIISCILCFVPYIIFQLQNHTLTTYLPFQSVWTTKEILAAGFPVNILGMGNRFVLGLFRGI